MGITQKTEQKVFSYIEEHGMAAPGDKIVVGVSGGADSLCLLFLLLEYARRVPLELAVAHVDHGIRTDAAEDARYVEELCRQAELPFFLRKADVPGLARKWKCSQEDAGRRIRYEAFRKAADGMGGARIAVAHNSNDNGETMLFHLFRGSGLKGLCGIAPLRDRIIRPILCLERREVEAYLEARGILWRRDSTNEEDDYSRNRIRHHILPYAEEALFPGAVEHMRRTAEVLAETEEYLRQQTAEALAVCVKGQAPQTVGCCAEQSAAAGPGSGAGSEAGTKGKAPAAAGTQGRRVDVEAFLGFHPAIRKRMLHELLVGLSPTGKDMGQIHVRDVLALFLREGNRSVDLPFGITAVRQYGTVTLERRIAAQETAPGSRIKPYSGTERNGTGRQDVPAWRQEGVTVPSFRENPEDFFVYDLGKQGKIEFTLFSAENMLSAEKPAEKPAEKSLELPKNQYTKWLDYDKMKESLVIRTRRTGDYLTIADGGGNAAHKSLKKYMITEKIPKQLRDEMPLLAAGNHILWIIGGRISESCKVDQNTKRILQVRLLQDPSQESQREPSQGLQ